jgi:pyruvate/2-oxoacid:ferredoxin oxidoreductase alpha subunit
VYGDRSHRGNLISSIYLSESDLEAHNLSLSRKYARIAEREQRADLYRCEDADVLLLACNTPSRMAKGAVEELRRQGVAAGLFRPLTLWPFPIRLLGPLLARARRLIVVDAGVRPVPAIENVRRSGGALPQAAEIVEKVLESVRPARNGAAALRGVGA